MYLAKGPMSIAELEDAIHVSRQAILKHLKDLEQRGFIEIHEVEKSIKTPGPNPHKYELKQAFVIRFDLNPVGKNARIITFQLGPTGTDDKELEDGTQLQPQISFKEKMEELVTLNKELNELTSKYKDISMKKNTIVQSLKGMIERSIRGDEEREVLELLMNNPEKAIAGFTLEEISEELDIREDFMKFIMNNLLRAGIIEENEEGQYSLR